MPGLENPKYGRGDPLRSPRDTLYPQKLTLTPPTRGGRSVGMVRSRTKATELRYFSLREIKGNLISFEKESHSGLMSLACFYMLALDAKKIRFNNSRVWWIHKNKIFAFGY
jgi:hypothetical protein